MEANGSIYEINFLIDDCGRKECLPCVTHLQDKQSMAAKLASGVHVKAVAADLVSTVSLRAISSGAGVGGAGPPLQWT